MDRERKKNPRFEITVESNNEQADGQASQSVSQSVKPKSSRFVDNDMLANDRRSRLRCPHIGYATVRRWCTHLGRSRCTLNRSRVEVDVKLGNVATTCCPKSRSSLEELSRINYRGVDLHSCRHLESVTKSIWFTSMPSCRTFTYCTWHVISILID